MEWLLNAFEREMKALKTWFETNKLSHNISKTKFMLFGYWQINKPAKLMLKGVESERVQENKYLIRVLGIF